MPAWFCILRLKSGTLYPGATTNLEQRWHDHMAGTACRTTKIGPPSALVFQEQFETFSEARQRETQIKRWSGKKKEALVAGEPRVLLATGRYIGEGFDDARLDTLFLTLPVSWRGTIAQYAGRLHRLIRDGVDAHLGNLFVHATRKMQADAQGEARARSATEAFLFRRLETLQQTEGKFLLNAALPIPFDERGQMEVDLLCAQARLAVELDDPRHLSDPEAYRRDRRKVPCCRNTAISCCDSWPRTSASGSTTFLMLSCAHWRGESNRKDSDSRADSGTFQANRGGGGHQPCGRMAGIR